MRVTQTALAQAAEVVALKVIDLEALGDGGVEGAVEEVGVLARAHCPQLCAYRGAWVVGDQLWVAMELLDGGSLASILSPQQPLPQPIAARVLRELLLGLDYLHTGQLGKPTIHRDLKAANVLMSCEGCVKLADFGASAQLSATRGQRDTFIGSPYWMAPEVITRSAYGAAADVWSLGCVAWELLCGAPPLAHVLPVRALFMIPEDEPPTLPATDHDGVSFSTEIRAFVSACLQKDPSARPSATDLLSHELFRHLDDAHDKNEDDSNQRRNQLRTPPTAQLDDFVHCDEHAAPRIGESGNSNSIRDNSGSFDGAGQPITWLCDAINRKKTAAVDTIEKRKGGGKGALETTILCQHASSPGHDDMMPFPAVVLQRPSHVLNGNESTQGCGGIIAVTSSGASTSTSSNASSSSSSSNAPTSITTGVVGEGDWDYTPRNVVSEDSVTTSSISPLLKSSIPLTSTSKDLVSSLSAPFVFPTPRPPGATLPKPFLFPEPRLEGLNGTSARTACSRTPPSSHFNDIALPAIAEVQCSLEDGDDASVAALARLHGALAAVDAALPAGNLLQCVLEALQRQGKTVHASYGRTSD